MPAPDYGIDPPSLYTTPDPPSVRVLVADGPLYPSNDLGVTDDTPIYLAFGARTTVRRHSGLSAAPKAGPARELLAAIWRSNSGFAVKTVVWVATMMNGVPAVAPSPDTGNPNEVLVEDWLVTDIPSDAPDGQQAVTIAGVYVYVLQKVPAMTDPMPVPKSPFSLRAQQYVLVSSFSKYILKSVPPTDFTGTPITF